MSADALHAIVVDLIAGGSSRCSAAHAGASTGPTTPEGMARTLAAMQAGRRRWLAKLKAEGKPIPCGRKKGGRNAPREEREHAAYLREQDRIYRPTDLQVRAERKAGRRLERSLRRAQRQYELEKARYQAADHARRKARVEAGFPYWTDEEWEKL